MRAALQRSLEITPDVRSVAMRELQTQCKDQLEIAARAFFAGDYSQVETACGYALSAARALRENQEMEMSRATVPEASTEALIAELKRRADSEKDKDAIKALAKPSKGGARGRG